MRNLFTLLLLTVAPGFAANPAKLDHSLPSFFIPNTGQTDSSVQYFVDTPDLRAGFTPRAALFQVKGLTLRVDFEGANPSPRIEAEERLPGSANFFLGNRPEKWKTAVPVYEKIRYRDLYPGVDMTYGGSGRRIKSEFLVAPGADPHSIRLTYRGADNLEIGANGDLIVRGESVEMREEAPVVYQETSAGRTAIAARYVLRDRHTLAFEIGAYDSSLPLIIDPTLSYATYLGGSGISSVCGLAVDFAGNLYVTGWTESLDFHISGPVQASNGGGDDAFIAKLNPSGNGFLYATYIGGTSDDRGAGIAVDGSGQAYVTGSTLSTNFPVASAAYSRLNGSLHDAFALKLSANGSMLAYSTYLGGSNAEYAYGIAVDSSGNAYIAGDTMSANYPVVGGVQTTFGGVADAFLTKLSSTGSVVYSTFLGGTGTEHAGGVAVDGSGNAYIAGGTTSTNFPVLGAIQSVNGGSEDVFLTKINAAGSQIVYSTYLGGNGGGSSELASGVAVDSAGNAYLAGVTNSANFPVTAGAFQTGFNGFADAFAAKINTAGSALAYSTYFGGTSFDAANAIAVDSGGNAYLAGYSSSAGLPSVAPVQATFNGFYDAFVSKLNPQGNALSFSTFYGGTGSDSANAIAIDANGNIFVGGQTSSLDMTLLSPIQSTNIGGVTGWVARFGVTAPPPQLPSAVSVSPSSGSANTVTFTAQFSDSAGGAALTSVALLLNTTASSNYACQVTYTPANGQFALANDVATSGSTTVIAGGGLAQNDQCTLNGAASSIVISGNNLTLTVALTFQPGFPGAKTVYLSAADANSNTGWVARGTWTVVIPPPQPTANSVSPNSSMGSSQTFTFVFSDTQNPLNITGMAMLFSTSLTQTNACSMSVDRNAGTVSLLWDAGNGSDSKAISSGTLLQNSQCKIGAASITLSGLSNIISLAITFKGAFSGVKNIYMFGSENGVYTTGWVLNGTYNIAAGGVPVPNSVVPASGSGPGQRFSFTVSDLGGASFLTGLAVLFSTSPGATTNACYLVYDRTVNTVSLAYDNPMNGAAPVTPGSSSIVSNSQCTLKAVNTTLVIGTTTIVVTLDLTFNATFFGAKNVYLSAVEPGLNSGFVSVGTWSVTGGAPIANTVSPNTGSGSSPSFTFTISDSVASSNINGMGMLITNGAPSNTANSCQMFYNVTAGTIGLYNDAGTTLTSKPIGSSNTLQNTQCAVGYTVGFPSGNSIVFTVNLSFLASFQGAKTVYLDAFEPNASSGWVAVGNWTAQ
jgi:hypothetical protein